MGPFHRRGNSSVFQTQLISSWTSERNISYPVWISSVGMWFTVSESAFQPQPQPQRHKGSDTNVSDVCTSNIIKSTYNHLPILYQFGLRLTTTLTDLCFCTSLEYSYWYSLFRAHRFLRLTESPTCLLFLRLKFFKLSTLICFGSCNQAILLSTSI